MKKSDVMKDAVCRLLSDDEHFDAVTILVSIYLEAKQDEEWEEARHAKSVSD